MAHGTVYYANPRTGEQRKAPTGFSWTNLFFGFFVPLLRSDWKWALIQFFAALFTAGLCWLVFPFIYNGLYASDLLKNGYRVAGNQSSNANQAPLPPPPPLQPTQPIGNSVEQSINCIACGQVNFPESQFCNKCGSNLKAVASPDSARNLPKIVLIACVAIGLLSAGVLFTYKYRREQSAAKSTADKEQPSIKAEISAPATQESSQNKQSPAYVWEAVSQTDRLSGRKSTYLELASSDTVMDGSTALRPVMEVNCDRTYAPRVTVMTKFVLADHWEHGEPTPTTLVAWRFDDGSVEYGRWRNNGEADGKMWYDNDEFISKMQRSQSLLIRFRPHDRGSADVEFRVAGFSKFFEADCGFPVVSKAASTGQEQSSKATEEGTPAGGRWRFGSRDGKSLWYLPADEHEVSALYIGCSKEQSDFFMRFQNVPDAGDGGKVVLSISLNGAAAKPQAVRIESGYLYPDEHLIDRLLKADEVKIGYEAASLNRRLTFHPSGLNMANIMSACGK